MALRTYIPEEGSLCKPQFPTSIIGKQSKEPNPRRCVATRSAEAVARQPARCRGGASAPSGSCRRLIAELWGALNRPRILRMRFRPALLGCSGSPGLRRSRQR